MDAKTKLQALRARMAEEGLSAWLQPVHDEYMNEYPPACARRVEWLCGFSGSAGTVAVTRDQAALFVDGRYVLQAKNETDARLYERHNIENMQPGSWLMQRVKTGDRVGYDPRLYTHAMVKRLETALQKKGALLEAASNLIDGLWKDRPLPPASAVQVHERKYSGETSESKRARIASHIAEAGADAAIVASPDSVCWLLNIRGSDVEGAPLALAPAIIDAGGKVWLFIEERRCSKAVTAHLGNEVTLCKPLAMESTLTALGKRGTRVLCDAQSLPVWYLQALSKAGGIVVEGTDPCLLPKAMKNATELKGIRAAHVRDGLAVTKFLHWLDAETARTRVTELDAAYSLLAFRAGHPLFKGPSFNTIAGSGPHGAIVHYRASEASNRTLKKGELFLLDSGGQYPDGTTDITRTVPIGKPSKEHKDRFTRVLKGHIAIATARFPEGTGGSQLDALARQFLWQAGLDYDHGTGHGVGHFLNVHEGPQRISKRGGDAPLMPGMVVSNEPGYYKSGAYGIRIESLVTVKQAGKSGGKQYLGFETLTCAPIDTRLVDRAMLTQEERAWLNRYHAWVFAQLKGKLDARQKAWLAKRCAAI